MAVFAPMPSASVSTATAVKPGFFSNWRKAKRRSFILICPTAELLAQRESSFPFHQIGAAMGQQCRGKFDRLTRLEPVFAKQFCRQLEARDVAKISVDAGNCHQPNAGIIDNRL